MTIVDDRNPNHRDDDFARKNGFPSRIASGGMASHLLGEYISRVCGVENVASVMFRLSRPLYPGQALQISGSVARLIDSTGHAFEARLMADGLSGATATAKLHLPLAD